MPFISDNTIDNGLAALKAGADVMYLNSSEPATYTAATSTTALGNKNFGAGAVYPGAIAAGSPSGRQVTSAAIASAAPGSITATGNATHNSVVNSAAGALRLEVAQALAAAQAVTAGNTFTMNGQTVRIANVGG